MSYQIFPEDLNFILEFLKQEIKKMSIPKKDSREKTAGIGRTCIFGLTKHRRVSGLEISKFTLKYPVVWKLLSVVGDILDFNFTSIMVNKDFQTKEHIDKNKPDTLNLIYGFGDYEGGELIYEGKEYDIKEKFLIFNGRIPHSTKPFTGNRYSVTFFSK